MTKRIIPLIFILLLPFFAVDSANLSREQRIRSQIEDAILTGDPIDLVADKHTFLAIHTESDSAKVKGAAIVLHGTGAHPNWVDVVQPLRTELPEYGWETLSIQLPVLAADAEHEENLALIPEAYPRIEAAIVFLKQRGINHIVLAAHSLGARMAVEFLAAKQPKDIAALVAVGLSADKTQPNEGALAALNKIQIPILDIFGSQDLETVMNSRKARRQAAKKANNSNYQQVEMVGANHFFHGLEQPLIKRVSGWLGKDRIEK